MIVLKAPDVYLQDLLRREGIPYRFECSSSKHIFITPTENQLILTDFPDAPTEVKSHFKKVKYIAPDSTGLLDRVGIVDINACLMIPVSANLGISERREKVIYFCEVPSHGKILILPLNLTQLLRHRGITPKKFWMRGFKFPYEDIAVTDRGGIRRLLTACINQFAQAVNLPFVRLSSIPGSSRSILGFRVDTDFSSPSLIEKAVRLSEKLQMRWTWFVTAEDDLSRLKSIVNILANQDVQLHCYRHVVYPDLPRNKMNFQKGKEIFAKIGIFPVGVAAPFGAWNENLLSALAELGFNYSSEFGYSYDDLPGRPFVNGKPSSVLQIPVHPISLGRLAAIKLNRKEIFEYYRRIIDLQCARHEPCFLYDHPRWIVHYYDVLKDILEYGVARCGKSSTLTDYSRWWQNRESVSYEIKLGDEGFFDLIVNGNCPYAQLAVEYNSQISSVSFETQRINLKDLNWIEISYAKKFNNNELYTRNFDLRMLINDRLRNFIRKIR